MINLPLLTCSLGFFAVLQSCHSTAPTQPESTAIVPTQTATLTLAKASQSMAGKKQNWQPAKLNGLVMGKATFVDMLKVFGQFQQESLFDKNGAIPSASKKPAAVAWYYYDNAPVQFPGRLVFIVEKPSNRVKSAFIQATNLSLAKAISEIGPGYIETRYDFEPCLGNGEAGPIYESPNGQLRYIEYRALGIAISMENRDEVLEIIYDSEPPGTPRSRCPKPKRK